MPLLRVTIEKIEDSIYHYGALIGPIPLQLDFANAKCESFALLILLLSPSLYSALSIIINRPFSCFVSQMRFSSFNATTTVASSNSSNNNQVLQYLCSKCNTVLKEIVESKEEEIQSAISYFSKKEECPKCGLRLANSLLKRKYQLIQDPNNTINKQQLSLLPHPKFQTAYDINNNRLVLDIKNIDPLLLYFTTGESVCIVGQAGFTNLLISRLCVSALLSSNRYDDGGFDSSHVIIIDAGGNNSDPYQCVSFARQYGLDIKKVLRSIIVTRAFTIYHLANLHHFIIFLAEIYDTYVVSIFYLYIIP
jgi:hypothetical protein